MKKANINVNYEEANIKKLPPTSQVQASDSFERVLKVGVQYRQLLPLVALPLSKLIY